MKANEADDMNLGFGDKWKPSMELDAADALIIGGLAKYG